MNTLQVAALIFDMDGLVLDTETTYFAAWRQAAAELGCELPEQFCASLSGCSGEMVRQRLQDYFGAGFDVAAFQQLSGLYWTQHVERYGIDVKPGFRAALAAADRRGWSYALATNSRRANAERCLRAAGLQQVFSVIAAADNSMRAKPAPDLFLCAAEALACPIADCLVLEDSPVGVRAAKAAGARCIMVPSAAVEPETAGLADLVLADLYQVADLISAPGRLPL
ncbi:HAD family phosphatase [Methylomonas sp. SURF-1]|uniref:HAD family phosphatase n=1 Tax=Methylomonas aurea TaxID=2952224 RepID=A0ABT1UMV4_9GAMM|nr:HAD family phosphatase [Methylomonas sp. SURF-1]